MRRYCMNEWTPRRRGGRQADGKKQAPASPVSRLAYRIGARPAVIAGTGQALMEKATRARAAGVTSG
jgi:hypothetical protein